MRVEFEGAIHEFPDDFTDADIQAALSQQKPEPKKSSNSFFTDAAMLLGVGPGKLRTSGIANRAPQDVIDTVSNVPGSAVDFAGNMAKAIMHPIDTAKGLGTLAAGGIDAAAQGLEKYSPYLGMVPAMLGKMTQGTSASAEQQPGWENPRQAASAVGGFYSDRYGGLSNIGNTLKTDPVGFMADASMLLSVGAGTLKMAGLDKAAASTMNVAQKLNPLNMAVEAARNTVVPATKFVYSHGLGMTTGSGKVAVEQALKGDKPFVDAMRGKITDEKMVENALDAVGKLKDDRAAAYEQAISVLKNANNPIDMTGIHNTFNGLLKRFGVGRDANGGLDFSRSRLSDKSAQDIVTAISDDLKTWGSRPGDTTALGLDTLKGRISELYTQNGSARKIAANMSATVGDTIKANVPGYAKMAEDYGTATDTIKTVQKALSLGDQASIDTAATKLITAIRKDNDFRRALMTGLDEKAGASVLQQAAGRTMSNPWSMRLLPSLVAGGGIGAAAVLTNPAISLLLLTASPRFAGELSVLLGAGARHGGKAVRALTPAAVPLEQAGKITNQR